MANHTKPAPLSKPAKPVSALLSQLPSPVGGVVIQNPSPSEKKELRRMGVEDVKKLPANFAEISQQAMQLATSEADDDDNIPLPVPADHKPLELNAVDINSLPKEQQARYHEMIQASLKQMNELLDSAPSGMERSVAAAVAAGTAPRQPAPSRPVIDDAEQPNYSTGAPKEQTAAEPAEGQKEQPAVTGNCARCGFPKDREDDVEMDEIDSEAYFDAIMAGKPFQKTFSRYNGRMLIVIRGLEIYELDAIRKQLLDDQKSGLCQNDLDLRVRVEQLQNCLQLVSLVINGKSVIICPASLKEWGRSPGAVCQALCEDDVLRTMSLYRTVSAVVNQFNAIEHKLEQLSNDPSFCKAGN